MRPMTHLLLVLEPSAMSKLLSARSKPPSTPLGSYPNVLKSFHRKILKNIWSSILCRENSARPSNYHELSNYRIKVSVRVGHTQFSNSLILDRYPNQQNFTYISGKDVFFAFLKKSKPLFQRSRCKDTNFIFGTVQICPFLSKFVHFCPFFLETIFGYLIKNQ